MIKRINGFSKDYTVNKCQNWDLNPGSLILEFDLIISILCYITGSEGIKRLNAQDQEGLWSLKTMELGKKRELYPVLIRMAGICCSNKTPKISVP